MGSVKDLQAHLRHARADTTAHEYMQALPESVQAMVGSVYLMLTKEGKKKRLLKNCYQTLPRLPKKCL
jgi:ABC-type transport system involved in Fe-S cluster assembly fused permease/ATPase subunit